VCERRYKATRSSVYVNRDIDASRLLIFIQNIVDLLHWLVMSSVGRAENYEDTDCVFVNVLLDKLWVESVA
jgi:hypothetical protein